MDLEAVSPEVLWKCDSTAIKRLSCFATFGWAQLQPFALDPARWRNDVPAVLNGASTGDLVEDILATCIDILCGNQVSPLPARNKQMATIAMKISSWICRLS